MQRGFQSQQRAGPGQAPVRNPWVDRHPESSSSSARSQRRAHLTHPRPHTIVPVHTTGPPPAADWLRPGPPQRLHGPQLNQQPVAPSVGSSGGDSAVVGSGGGGGYQPGSPSWAKCDSFCYHCLQVVYIAGILTGLSLVIAGSVLRGSPRRGDLLVLVYIGVLLAAVCTLLLSVQYCVRTTVKERRRLLRTQRLPVIVPAAELTEMQELNHPRHPHDYTDVRIETLRREPRPIPSRPYMAEVRTYPSDFNERHHEVRSYPNESRTFPAEVYPTERPHEGRTYPSEVRSYPSDVYPSDFSEVRRSGRSRSSHSSHGRRYYLHDEVDAPFRSDEWERQPYQPLIHRPPR